MAGTSYRLAAVVAGVALTLTGCGQSKAGAGTPTSADDPSAKASPAAALKLDKSPFCAKLDKQAMADALGSTGPVTLTRSLSPGQKYHPAPGFPKTTASAWQCEFSSAFKGNDKPRVNFYASISAQPYTKASFAEYVKQRSDPKYQDKGAVCENEAKADLVDTATSAACHKKTVSTKSTFAAGYAFITYRALVDGSLVICGAGSNTEKDFDQMKTAGKKLCTDFFETVSD